MKPEEFKTATENLRDRLEFRGGKVPHNRLGWWIRLHFTDDGQFAIEEATKLAETIVTTEPGLQPESVTDQLSLPLSLPPDGQ